MSEENPTPDPQNQSSVGDAWSDVGSRFEELADAIAEWAKAAVNDPDVKRHGTELRDKLSELGKAVGNAIDDAAASDVGQQVKGAAVKTGDAISQSAKEFGEAAKPHVASAMSAVAEALGKAAEKVESAAKKDTPEEAAGPASEDADDAPGA